MGSFDGGRSPERRIAGAWLRGAGRGCLLQLVAVPFAVAMVGLPLALYALAPLHGPRREALLAGAFGAMLLVFGVSLVAGMRALLARRASRLDACFPELAGEPFTLAGRAYQGACAGRRVDVFFLKGPLLLIYVEARLAARLAVGLDGQLARAVAPLARSLTGVQAVEVPMRLPGLAASAHDAAFGAAALASPEVEAALRALFGAAGRYELRTVTVQPGSVALHAHRVDEESLTPASMAEALQALTRLAGALESLPPPAVPAAPGRLDGPAALRRLPRLQPKHAAVAVLGPMLLGAVSLLGFSIWLALQ